ncbi:hypothetical protein ACN38_g992 [Penicillium nordicum]|uniref:Uncharacterized protein n=1 Tax=Penicillium nordicum TaxID=229535 RepID=A0A0M9WK97_9EURO|nr:hypothetical protein ACN38_g992 [Penicillium nordicum]
MGRRSPKSSNLELNGRRMDPWIEFQRAYSVCCMSNPGRNSQNYTYLGAAFNTHSSGATLQRLVSAKKTENRSDLALAPFSIFVILCRCRVVVRAVLTAVIELSLPYASEGIRVSWGAFFFFLGFGFSLCVRKNKIKQLPGSYPYQVK